MAVRDMLVRQVGPLLPQERVQQVFVAQGGRSPWLVATPAILLVIVGAVGGVSLGGLPGGLLGLLLSACVFLVLTSLFITRRIVAVTNSGVVVFTANWSGAKPTGMLVRLPRQTLIGEPQGNRRPITLGGEKLWVNRRFRDEIDAANAMAGRTAQ
jgi:hypothetical protein